jgi:hypothetical protein
MAVTALAKRHKMIDTLRKQGAVADAERYGWLSLTGALLGLPVTVIVALDPWSEAPSKSAGRRDLLGTLNDAGIPARIDTGNGTGIDTLDPTDGFGFALASYAASTAATTQVDGRAVATGVVHDALRARLRLAVSHG